MKQFPDGDNNYPLEEKSSSVAGSPPTADNFNGVTEELVNPVLEVGFPLDPLSGALIGSDGKPMLESESNKQVLRSIQHLDQDTYLKGVDDRNLLIKNLIGEGIVQGLVATKTDTLIVTVSKGLGYDGLGHQILLSDPIIVDLNSEASTTEKTISLALRYSIVKADYKIGDKNPNYKDTIVITAVHGADVQSDDFVISDITINSTGITNIIAEGFKFNNTFVENTNLINSLSSILSKGADGSANLSGTGFKITGTDTTKSWEIGNDSASIKYIQYESGYQSLLLDFLSKATGQHEISLSCNEMGINTNWATHKAKPFSIFGMGGFTLGTDNDLLGNPSNINFNPSIKVEGGIEVGRGKVNINGTPIIETGSVAGRGTYTKFYDGMMICIYDSVAALPTWIFPAPFISEPILIGYQYKNSDEWITSINIVSITNTQIFVVTNDFERKKTQISVIGRWK